MCIEKFQSVFKQIYEYKKNGKVISEISLLEKVISDIDIEEKMHNGVDLSVFRSEAWSLLGSAYTLTGQAERALQCFLKSNEIERNREQSIVEYSNALFVTNYMNELSLKKRRDLSQKFNDFFAGVEKFEHFVEKKNILRIGYISPDFRRHPVTAFVYPLLEHFSINRFEVYCYSANEKDDFVTEKLKTFVTVWRDIKNLDTETIADFIYNDKIDILFDLAGHTKNNCLPVLAYKPAPIQISGIGYFNTTGLKTVDYFLSDIYCDSNVNTENEFSEEIWRLEHSHFCYAPSLEMPSCGEVPFRKNGYITFGSFNNFNKMTDSMLLIWNEILKKVVNSKLILKSQIFNSEEGTDFVKKRLFKLGLPLEQIVFRGFSENYLEEYKDIDVALDTAPYTGGITTCEALYMGVPVITMEGNKHGSRFGVSLLENAGISELIACDAEDYIKKACLLAGDKELLTGLHQNLRQILKKSSLMNEEQYINEIENMYESMWDICLQQQEKEYISKNKSEELHQKIWQYITNKNYYAAEVLAKKLKSNGFFKQEMLEILAGIYIETLKDDAAENVVHELKEVYKINEQTLFLRMRVAYMKREDEKVIQLGKQSMTEFPKMKNRIKAMIHNLMGNSYRNLSESRESIKHYLVASECADNKMDKSMNYSNYLFNLHYLSDITKKQLFHAHKKYNELYKNENIYEHVKKIRHKKIRIGYISPDMCHHVVIFFSYALFRDYDRNVFEVYCYANGREDTVSRQIEYMVDHWENISCLDPKDAAAKIYQDEIDILFDLSGHTRNGCLPILAHKPAPIQISGIGYFDTTGLNVVDYFLVDRYTDPEGLNEPYFVEKLLRLENSHFCYTAPGSVPDIKPMAFLKNGYITFGSFNNFTKTTDEILSIWLNILMVIPDAHLLLKNDIFNKPYGVEKVKMKLEKMGFPMERVELRVASLAYLDEYADIDIALDTYPYPGGGTTCDALYMGIPVITFIGERHGARFGYSLLKNIELDELCADSWSRYIEIAIELSRDKEKLKNIHQNLRKQMQKSPLMDGFLYMKDLEKRYLEIFYKFIASGNTKEELITLAKDFNEQFHQAGMNDLVAENIYKGIMAYTFGEQSDDLLMNLAKSYHVSGDYKRSQFWAMQANSNGYKKQDEITLLMGNNYQAEFDYVRALKEFSQGETLEHKKSSAYLQNLLGNPDKGTNIYLKASQDASDLETKYNMYSAYLLSLHYQNTDKFDLYRAHRHYETLLNINKVYSHRNHRKKLKIHVGYISPDFRQHVMYYFYYQLLANYNKSDFHVTCYSISKIKDNFTNTLKPLVDEWKDISDKSDEVAAKIIFEDSIDILIDLAGHSAGGALPILAYKPAPIQISGLGYIDTSGLSTVDYFLTDVHVDPVGKNDEFFTEKLMRFSNSQFCYTGRLDVPIPKGAPCKKNGFITFGSFNKYVKHSDEILLLWNEILKQVKNSRLVLKSQVFISASAKKLATKRLAKLGFDIAKVDFVPATLEYMEEYLNIDIALDSYPYPGGGTTCDALYMGVPVVSLFGERHGSRFGYSILKNVGLEDLAVQTEKEYVAKAVALALDVELLDMLHKNLRTIMLNSKLMDEKLYITEFEELMKYSWNEYLKKEKI